MICKNSEFKSNSFKNKLFQIIACIIFHTADGTVNARKKESKEKIMPVYCVKNFETVLVSNSCQNLSYFNLPVICSK